MDSYSDSIDDTPLITRHLSQQSSRENPFKSMLTETKLSQLQVVSKKSVQEQSPVKYRLSFLLPSMFATALEDVLTQFRILAECNNELYIKKTLKELAKLRKAKFGIESPAIEEELARINPKDLKNEDLKNEDLKLNKLIRDRNYCIDVLTATYLELALRSTYNPIVEATQAVHNRYQYYAFLVEEEAKNRLNRRELSKQVRQQRNRARGLIYDINLAVEKLRNEVDDARLNKEVPSRYIDKWEAARGEQNRRRIEDEETDSSERIAFYRKQLESEQRVHHEQELYTNLLINDLLKKLEVWVNKYENDIANVDLKIQIKKLDAMAEKEKREEMEKLLELHAIEINNWIKFKDDRERANQYQKMMTNAAHVVQAWWRGLLVRLQIGPYRPRKIPPVKAKLEKKK